MIKLKKTNVARLMDQAGIDYSLVEYDVDETDLGAKHVADSLGENIEQVFKTIVLQGDKVKHLVCIVPGAEEVDLKQAAKVSGNKKCEPLPLKELLPTTGYIRGGCCPIGMKRNFPTYMDASAQKFSFIYVSAGVRGLQLKIAPDDLLRQARAQYATLIKGEDERLPYSTF
ncbi:MAG: Cys-tRNA(Pro) deacylase [Bacteroidaceae bacterium]